MVSAMIQISKETAIRDLSESFNVGVGLSELRDGTFYICKWEFTRNQVFDILKDYFSTRAFGDGSSLAVSPVQYIFTEVYFKNSNENRSNNEEDPGGA